MTDANAQTQQQASASKSNVQYAVLEPSAPPLLPSFQLLTIYALRHIPKTLYDTVIFFELASEASKGIPRRSIS